MAYLGVFRLLPCFGHGYPPKNPRLNTPNAPQVRHLTHLSGLWKQAQPIPLRPWNSKAKGMTPKKNSQAKPGAKSLGVFSIVQKKRTEIPSRSRSPSQPLPIQCQWGWTSLIFPANSSGGSKPLLYIRSLCVVICLFT